MAEATWHPFHNGTTLGQEGSESGFILWDEEHPAGARITLERDGQIAPFAITCGIYGCMMHTRFFSIEPEANGEYSLMKDALAALLEIPEGGSDESRKLFMDGIAAFVEKYP